MSKNHLKLLLDIAGFQVIWFACALGVPHGMEWIIYPLGIIYIAQHIYFANQRVFELSLMIKATILGMAFDSGLHLINAIRFFEANSWFQPLWMTTLWASFGASLNSSFSWLKSRYLLGAILGAVVGPLSYYGGEKFGVLTIQGTQGFVALGVCWAIAMPIALSWLNQKDLSPTSKLHNESLN
jgi:hypothetical protein